MSNPNETPTANSAEQWLKSGRPSTEQPLPPNPHEIRLNPEQMKLLEHRRGINEFNEISFKTSLETQARLKDWSKQHNLRWSKTPEEIATNPNGGNVLTYNVPKQTPEGVVNYQITHSSYNGDTSENEFWKIVGPSSNGNREEIVMEFNKQDQDLCMRVTVFGYLDEKCVRANTFGFFSNEKIGAPFIKRIFQTETPNYQSLDKHASDTSLNAGTFFTHFYAFDPNEYNNLGLTMKDPVKKAAKIVDALTT